MLVRATRGGRRRTMISKLFSREPDTRVFFATDIHGSETCWRKFLNSGKHYEAKVMILGGDMTGKALVPIVEERPGHWHATLLENRREFESEDELKEFEDSVKRRGYYPFRTDPDEMGELESDEEMRNELFYKEMLGTIERWMRMADEKFEGTDIECFVSPGNDDQFEVDEIISSAKRVRLAEGKVVEFGDFQMVSTGWANRTPWNTYREEDEEDLAARIEKVVSEVTAPAERTIFSFHCPPYASGLDDAPELTEDLRPKHGGRSIVPVGSTAVKGAIKEGQPAPA